MNNSKIAFEKVSLSLDQEPTNTEYLKDREAELVRIIEAVERINQSDDWKTLKLLVFGGVVESLEKKLRLESEKSDLDISEIHKIQGQLAWARKYADLNKLNEVFRTELLHIKNLNK